MSDSRCSIASGPPLRPFDSRSLAVRLWRDTAPLLAVVLPPPNDTYAHGMTDRDNATRPTRKTWTTTYRMPIAVVCGLLGVLCAWGLVAGGTTEKWVGGIGLVVLIAWMLVFQTLHRRGY